MSDLTPPPPEQDPYGRPGGYGASPPLPPGALGAGGYDAVEAMRYGWAKFSRRPAELLVPMLVTVVVVGLVFGLLYAVVFASVLSGGGTTVDPETGRSASTAGPGSWGWCWSTP